MVLNEAKEDIRSRLRLSVADRDFLARPADMGQAQDRISRFSPAPSCDQDAAIKEECGCQFR